MSENEIINKIIEEIPESNEELKPKRPVGRPKKEKIEEIKPKRQVGRPRTKEIIEQPKRSVGRPKKINEEIKVKRPKGRPKKEKIEEEEIKPKKTLGRPLKFLSFCCEKCKHEQKILKKSIIRNK